MSFGFEFFGFFFNIRQFFQIARLTDLDLEANFEYATYF